MEKNQFELCLEVLQRLDKAGILNELILIGGWCPYFYKDYFPNTLPLAPVKTRDLDFLISNPSKIKCEAKIPELLKDLGFVTTFRGNKGYIALAHPDLILEFLVPEKGLGTDKPYPLPKLGINATALGFLSFLSSNTIKIKVENFHLTLPHPANFALHKLIIFQRRPKKEKAIKDRASSVEILRVLIRKGESAIIKNAFQSIPKGWQRKIIVGLDADEEKDILEILR